MNTRDASAAISRTYREVMDALATALQWHIDADVEDGALTPEGSISAMDAYRALLAEGSASSEGAEAVGHIISSYEIAGKGFVHTASFNPHVRLPHGTRLYIRQQPAQGEHEQRSGEGSERRPIADEVVGALDRMDALLDPSRELLSVPYTSATYAGSLNDMRIIRAALESALPRGLPAGGDALVLLDKMYQSAWDRDNGFPNTILHPAAFGEHYAALRTLLATAEQPSCGQDARDAERWRALLTCARIRVVGHAGFHPDGESRKANPEYRFFCAELWTHHDAGPAPENAADFFIEFADAAIAAKQRQSGTP